MAKKKEWKLLQEELWKNETESDWKKIVFIEYEDICGNVSDRLIKIEKVYKKDGKLYLFAYCYLRDGMRTFSIDRILTMKEKYEGSKIKDIDTFLSRVFPDSPPDDFIENLVKIALE